MAASCDAIIEEQEQNLDFPETLDAVAIYKYVRSHMRGFVPVFYTVDYIRAVLEYIRTHAIAADAKILWLRNFKQHFGCIACNRRFPYHASELLRRRRRRRCGQ